jgi:hypothetical protein
MIEKTNNRRLPRFLLAAGFLLALHPAALIAQDSFHDAYLEPAYSVAEFANTVQVVGFTLSDAGVSNEYQEEAPIELTAQEDTQSSPSDNPVNDDAELKSADSEADEPEENALPKSFPEDNLRGGIVYDSFQRAVAQGDIAATTINVENSRVPAPELFRFDQPCIWKTWESPNICYRPLYFEDANVERYGIHCRLQPAVSGVHFLTNVFALPYKRGFHDHHKCVHGLGYYPAGDCSPAYWPRLEKAKAGFAAEVLTVGTIITLL